MWLFSWITTTISEYSHAIYSIFIILPYNTAIFPIHEVNFTRYSDKYGKNPYHPLHMPRFPLYIIGIFTVYCSGKHDSHSLCSNTKISCISITCSLDKAVLYVHPDRCSFVFLGDFFFILLTVLHQYVYLAKGKIFLFYHVNILYISNKR